MIRFAEPWRDPVWRGRARLAADAIGKGYFTPSEVVPLVAGAIGCKCVNAAAAAGALIIAEDLGLVSFYCGKWSRLKRTKSKRAPVNDPWRDYSSCTEVGAVMRGGIVQGGAPARPLDKHVRIEPTEVDG